MHRHSFVRPSLFVLPLLFACAASSEIDPNHLKGAWTSHGDSFEMDIRDDVILFEFDMREHPYRLDGDLVIIDFQNPALGMQRKRIVRLTPDRLEWRDLQWDGITVYRRVR